MKPLPAYRSAPGKPEGEGMPSLPIVLSPSSSYSAANRRVPASCPAQRAYPWLLFFSTAVAALFCLLYITKPVIVPAPAMIAPLPGAHASSAQSLTASTPSDLSPQPDLMPSASALPGEAENDLKRQPGDPRGAESAPPSISAFEETNLRVQHVLSAEAPGGQLDRIVLDVPVLYQSRNLRWTAAEVAAARTLLIRLMDYQDKSRELRAEGGDLLAAWNRLIEQSLPAIELRADSPSLPANQQDAADAPRPSALISTDAIQIHPAGK